MDESAEFADILGVYFGAFNLVSIDVDPGEAGAGPAGKVLDFDGYLRHRGSGVGFPGKLNTTNPPFQGGMMKIETEWDA